MSEVTRILSAIEQGDSHAAEHLLPLVYDELRLLAAQKMSQEAPGQTLQATALVHEAYLRLVDVDQAQIWNSRRHFFAAAAEAMRRILVEYSRARGSFKRGGGRERLDLDDHPRKGRALVDRVRQLPFVEVVATEGQLSEEHPFVRLLAVDDGIDGKAFFLQAKLERASEKCMRFYEQESHGRAPLSRESKVEWEMHAGLR